MKNIARKFYFYVFAALTVLIIVAIYFYYYHRRQVILEDQNIELKAIADEKINQIVSWRNEKFSDALVISDNGIFTSVIDRYLRQKNKSDSIHIYRWINEFRKRKDYSSVFLLDTSLNCIACDSIPYIPDMNLLQSVIDSGKAVFSHFYISADRSVFIDVYAPLILREPVYKKVGILILRINPNDYLFDIIQKWPTPSRSAEFLMLRVEGDSLVYLNKLRHSDKNPLTFRFPVSKENLPASMAARGIRGIVEGTDYRGVEVIADIQDIPETQWLTVTKVDIDEIYSPLTDLISYVIILGFILISSTALLIAFLWRNQNAALYKKLYKAETEKQALLKNFEYLTKYANDIILLLDDKGNIIYANERTIDQYGYSLDELYKMNIADLRYKSNEPETQAIFDAVIQKGGLVYEEHHRKKDGTLFPIEASSRFINLDTKNYFQSIIRDISEKKSSENKLMTALKDKDILLKEIHHRVKNNLQTISSLLNLHSNFSNDYNVKKILLDSQNRIKSMALVHQQLYSDNIAEVDSEKYINNLLAHLLNTFNPDERRIKIHVDIDNYLLKIDTVIPLGLILNEIISNIFKHAFPGSLEGNVRIEFKLADKEFRLKISDDGIGLPAGFDYQNSHTLGMQLIHILAEQINGSIEIQNNTGVEYAIVFKE